MVSAAEATASPRQCVGYYRVSTSRQAEYGLSLEGQREDVRRHVDGVRGTLVAEFVDVMSGRKNRRPQLNEALRICRIRGATLVIARLDRLSRNVGMIAELMESGLQFVAADFPDANRFTIHVLAAVAEYESALASERVKAAIAAAKARGVRFGWRPCGRPLDFLVGGPEASARASRARAKARADDLAPIVWPLFADGASRKAIAEELNRRAIPSPRGGKWHAKTISRLLQLTRGAFEPSHAAELLRALAPLQFRAIRRDESLGRILRGLRSAGKTLTEISDELNQRRIEPPRRRGWRPSTIWRLLKATKQTPAQPGEKASLRRWGAGLTELRKRVASVVPLIWELRRAGCPTCDIAAELNRRNLPSPRREWTQDAVARILRMSAHCYAFSARGAKPARQRCSTSRRDALLQLLAPVFSELLILGRSRPQIAAALNQRGFVTVRGRRWSDDTVRTAIGRLTRGAFLSPEAALAVEEGLGVTRRRLRSAALAAVVRPLKERGLGLGAIANELNRQGIATPRKCSWHNSTVNALFLTEFAAPANAKTPEGPA